MEIKPSISEGLVHENKPKSSQTSTDTQVIIRDGETIIIGGLIQKKQTTLRSYNIPILSNIPILNTLLGQEEKTDHKIEISVLITPHIIHDSQDQVNEKL